MNSKLGQSLLETRGELEVRNQVLATALSRLINTHLQVPHGRGLDVGCKYGSLADILKVLTPLQWSGIDPLISEPTTSPGGANLVHGWAHEMPFESGYFDCVLFANVFEHISPELRRASIREIGRVLRVGGIIVGQLPNPYFPIESHSRLPFMGWLPVELQKRYWRLAPVPWEHDFHVVTINHLTATFRHEGLAPVFVRGFNYPTQAIPKSWRWAARVFAAPMRVLPWSWQFVARKLG
jgi:SAM-dependent methyltransferase